MSRDEARRVSRHVGHAGVYSVPARASRKRDARRRPAVLHHLGGLPGARMTSSIRYAFRGAGLFVLAVLAGCANERPISYRTTEVSKFCIEGVTYFRWDRGISPLLRADGKPVPCGGSRVDRM